MYLAFCLATFIITKKINQVNIVANNMEKTNTLHKPYILSIINQKGGVAKTTTAINLAHGLALEGQKVLFIDIDPQGNATSILQKDANNKNTVYQIFANQAKANELAYQSSFDVNLYFIPSSIQLAETESLLAGNINGFFKLSDSLVNIDFDIAIIDCPPSLSMLTINALVASHGIIVPIQISKFSIDGIQSILDAIGSVKKRYNKELHILGALVTFYNPRTTIAQAVLPTIKQYLPVFETKISQSVAVEEAHLLKKTLYLYKTTSKPATEYKQLVQELLNAVIKG